MEGWGETARPKESVQVLPPGSRMEGGLSEGARRDLSTRNVQEAKLMWGGGQRENESPLRPGAAPHLPTQPTRRLTLPE